MYLFILANKGGLLLKLKHVNVVWSLQKKKSFNNFNSSLVVAVCTLCWTIVIYFCCSVFQVKPNFYFDGLPWIPYSFCVYMIWR